MVNYANDNNSYGQNNFNTYVVRDNNSDYLNNEYTSNNSYYYSNNNNYNNKYNKNNNNYNGYYSGENSLNNYYRNYLDRYDYLSEEKTLNFQKNNILCGVKGLSNNGNNCFLNSTIQCLKHCLIFTKYIINESVTSNGAFGEYKKLIEKMCSKNYNQLNALALKRAMRIYNPIYSDNEQHDSTIFFNDLLNALNNELCEESNYEEEEYDNISSNELFQIKYQKCMSKSKVNEYFSFFIKEMTVFDCGEKMIDYEEYYYLDLPIFNERNEYIKTLKDALDNYTKKSYDYGKNSFMCYKHQKKERSYNQNLFASLPEILVISLKRVINGQHIDHYIEYKERIDMRNYIHSYNNFNKLTEYELFAEIIHYGTANGGHKIAICKNFNTNIWYRFNDSIVTVENDIISSNAFLLFYKRV